jgi:hypothetical protein
LERYVREHGQFPIKARLIEWCQKNAAIFDKEPDEKTVREAIKKHGLDEIAVSGNPGNQSSRESQKHSPSG